MPQNVIQFKQKYRKSEDLDSHVQHIKSAIDIVSLISESVDLEKSGDRYVGSSPKCNDKTPSLVVYPHTQSFCDYSSAGDRNAGDCFDWMQHSHGYDFKEALVFFEARLNIKPIGVGDADWNQIINQRKEAESVERVLGAAASYYHDRLDDESREYMRAHYGLTDETIDKNLVGYSTGSGLFEHLTENGFSEEEVYASGLFLKNQYGGKEVFCHRLVFPYVVSGSVKYMIGRSTDRTHDWDKKSKYKKLPLHNEKNDYISKQLKNHLLGVDSIEKDQPLLITEGITDCWAAHQAGIPCISPVTIRFSNKDIEELIKASKRASYVIICNDSEKKDSKPGESGALSTAEKLEEAGIKVKIATLPRQDDIEKIDLNEFIRDNGKESLRQVLCEAKTLIEFQIDKIPEDTPKTELDDILGPIFDSIVSSTPAAQEGYRNQIKARFGLTIKVINQMQKSAKARARNNSDRNGQIGSTKAIYGEIRESSDEPCYLIDVKEGTGENALILEQKISSFILEPTSRIEMPDGKETIICDAITDSGEIHKNQVFDSIAWKNKQNLMERLNKLDMQWVGSDQNVQGLKRLVRSKNPQFKKGVPSIGYYDVPGIGPRWITKDEVISEDGVEHDSDAVFLPTHNAAIHDRVKYPQYDGDISELANDVLDAVGKIHDKTVTHPLLGWFFSCAFKPRIVRKMKSFPALMIWGTRGSGKSSLINDVFWRFYGIGDSGGAYSANDTQFVMLSMLSSTTTIPVFMDEYKPSDMSAQKRKFFESKLREAYNQATAQRGTAAQEVVTYNMTAPIVIGGEARSQDPAVLDRVIIVSPNRNAIDQHPEYRAAFKRAKSLPIEALAKPFAQWVLTISDEEVNTRLDHACARIDEYISGIKGVSLRQKNNLSVAMFGLDMLNAWLISIGSDLIPISIEDLIASTIEDLIDGDNGTKTLLDTFIEACHDLAIAEKLIPEHHYVIEGGKIYLSLRSSFMEYQKLQASIGSREDISTEGSLRKMAKESEQIGGYIDHHHKRIRTKTIHGYYMVIDIEKADEYGLDIDTSKWPTENMRSNRRYY